VADPDVRAWLKLQDPLPPPRTSGVYTLGEIREGVRSRAKDIERIMKAEGGRNELEQKVFQVTMLTATRARWVEAMQTNLAKKANPSEVKTFRVENDQLRNLLGLPLREGLRYSAREIAEDQERFRSFLQLAARASKRDEESLTLLDTK